MSPLADCFTPRDQEAPLVDIGEYLTIRTFTVTPRQNTIEPSIHDDAKDQRLTMWTNAQSSGSMPRLADYFLFPNKNAHQYVVDMRGYLRFWDFTMTLKQASTEIFTMME